MKALIINGSPKSEGNTALALRQIEDILSAEGIDTEIVQVGSKAIRGCVACGRCRELGRCVFDDLVNKVAPKFAAADALIVGSPVYYASANGTLTSFLDRLFFSTGFDKRMKVGAAVVAARRGGTTAAFDQLNKYFTISGMPIASSQYWNNVFGLAPGDVAQDAEGMQTMRTLARNMAFLIKSIALGKERYGLPEAEEWTPTNFIR